jgi:Ni/Co efflux regulator RcnB
MTKRIQKLVLAVAALAALALGGSVLAQAQTTTKAASEKTSAPDTDNVQSGDQTTPDTVKKGTARNRHHHAVRVSLTDPAGGGSGQSGSQTAPDTGSSSETSSETAGESAPGNDGPGGHADEPGNANADHQFQGTE